METEILKDIPGYEGLYQASTLGRIYSIRSKKFLAISPNTTYAQVCLSNKGKAKCFSVHRLVAMTFLPNPENLPQVHHKDGNHFNNALTNLQWISKEDNCTEYLQSDYFKEYVEEYRRKCRENRQRKYPELFGTATKNKDDQEGNM